MTIYLGGGRQQVPLSASHKSAVPSNGSGRFVLKEAGTDLVLQNLNVRLQEHIEVVTRHVTDFHCADHPPQPYWRSQYSPVGRSSRRNSKTGPSYGRG